MSNAKQNAIAAADAELNNAGLPTYSEVIAALKSNQDHQCRSGVFSATKLAKSNQEILGRVSGTQSADDPASVAAEGPRYVVCDGWGHLFGAGMPESTVRFVYDKRNSVILDMHIETSRGWIQASQAQMEDVAESIHDNLDWASGKSVEEQLSALVHDVSTSDVIPSLDAMEEGVEG